MAIAARAATHAALSDGISRGMSDDAKEALEMKDILNMKVRARVWSEGHLAGLASPPSRDASHHIAL